MNGAPRVKKSKAYRTILSLFIVLSLACQSIQIWVKLKEELCAHRIFISVSLKN
jgi:hypothetical protein